LTIDSDAPPNPFPVFTLNDINGLQGAAAWIETCLTKRRAVMPLIQHRLITSQTPEARLLSTAAAMEYWVSSHARSHDWANGVAKFDVPHAIAGTISEDWAEWIGEPKRWADLFSTTHNQLKHEPVDVDPSVADALEFSGRWLLTAAILDQCAGTAAPSQRIFSRGLTYSTADSVRRSLSQAPRPSRTRRR
jgi:hypothetical protein